MTSPSSSTLAAKIRENPKAFSAPPNSHLIEITYATATEKRGERVILTSHIRTGDRITDDYSHTKGSRVQGMELLKMLGYTVVAMGETHSGYFAAVKEAVTLEEALAAWVARKGAKVA